MLDELFAFIDYDVADDRAVPFDPVKHHVAVVVPFDEETLVVQLLISLGVLLRSSLAIIYS